MNTPNIMSSCPDSFRASSRAKRDRRAVVDGRVKPGHDEEGTLAILAVGSETGR